MKKLYFLFSFILLSSLTFSQSVIITRVVDGGLPSDGCSGASGASSPKAIELYVDGTIDFTSYTYDLYSNGGTTANSESLTDFGIITDAFVYIVLLGETTFDEILPGATKHIGGGSFNGDDTITITSDGSTIVDQFGVIGTDGSGEAWEYLDTYAKRNDSNGPNSTFTIGEWTIGTVNEFDGTDCATLSAAVSFGTFSYGGTPCGISLGSATYTCTSSTIGDGNDTVTVEIPYTGSDATITSVTTTAQGGSVGGDNPASVADGTITITGLLESEAWNITINGGNCDGTTVSGTIPAAECDPTPSTCYDLSAGPEQFESVVSTPNSDGDEWTFNAGTYNMNGYCGSGCAEQIETWLILGPLDMTGVSDFSLILDAATQFGDNTALNVQYTSSYSGCPSGSSWTSAGTISSAGNYNIDLSTASGTDVFIGVQYIDTDNFTSWSLSNVELASFNTCPVLGTPPVSDCATCDLALGTETYVCQTNTAGDNNDTVIVEIPYTGSESTITSLSTTIQGVTIGGDDPTTVADGTITLSGLSEGDAWDLTINGGDCDGTTVSGTIPSAECDPLLTTNVGITGNVDGVYINEIHYDNASTDVGEFVEIAGPAGTDLSVYTISLYNGGDGELYDSNDTFPLSGTIDDEGSGVGAIVLYIPTGIQNGAPDGVALSKSGSNDIQFLTYEGVINNAGDGPAIGLTSEDIGVSETSSTPIGSSLEYDEASMSWVVISDDTPGDYAQGTLSNEEFDIAKFSVYPNPTSTGYVNIISNSSDAIQAQVFDILGKEVINNTVENNRLNVSGLNAGIYIVKLTQNDASITKKLVVK